ncbi:MAG: RNA pseudouridine synthase [Bacteroidetes bacterium]|nr:MAG: RNA pseudouridine synthase [Bacteroidota bacterium]
MIPEILHEDNHLIIVNKPFGVLTHGDRTGDASIEDIVRLYVKEKYAKPGNVYLKAVHRLDRPVSGALILARTSKAHERMALQFKKHLVHKTYWALTARRPSPNAGTVSQFIRKDTARNTVSWHDTSGDGRREAVTEYKVLKHIEPYYLIKLHPVTGRSHQLRVMLRSKRCPIIGDVKYNGRAVSNPRSIMLHSRIIRFTHPVSKEDLMIEAPLPDLEEWNYIAAIGL